MARPKKEASAKPKRVFKVQRPKDKQGKYTKESAYTRELAIQICTEIAVSDKSMSAICEANPAFPSRRTAYQWLAEHKEFQDLYNLAKRQQAEVIADQMLEIADDGTNDYMERLNFNGANKAWELNGEHVQRSRVRIDTRKWVLANLHPSKYGQRVVNEHQGPSDPNAPPIGVKVVFVESKHDG